MLNRIVLNGLDLSEAESLPLAPASEVGKALAHIPGWSMLLDPDYLSIQQQSALNRARRNSFANLLNGELAEGNFPSGASSIDNTDSPLNLSGPVSWNPDEWTYFVVFERVSGGPSIGIRAFAEPVEDDQALGEITPHMGVNTSGIGSTISVFERRAPGSDREDMIVRIEYTSNESFIDRAAMVMVTFSTDRGLRMYENGILKATEASDTRALTKGFKSGEWQMFRNARAHWGHAGLLSRDLSRPEAEADRIRIERFMLDKYQIQVV